MHIDKYTTRFTDLFVERPIVALVLSLVLLMAGLAASRSIPVLQYPQINSVSIEVTTPFVGVSADIAQGFITEPIERVASTIPGLDYISSTTQAGMSTVTLWLQLNVDSNDTLAELTTRLSQIRYELPAGAEDPQIEIVRADRPHAAFYLSVRGNGSLDMAQLNDIVRRDALPAFTAIDGVQRVSLFGSADPAIRIWLDPLAMQRHQVSIDDVTRALRANNLIPSLGYTESDSQRIDLLTNTTLTSASEFAQMPIRGSGIDALLLSAVARVELSRTELPMIGRVDQENVIFLGVYPTPGANEIDVADAMYEVIDQLNTTNADGTVYSLGYDGTRYMRSALHEIIVTLVETVLLVGLVVVALMGSFRAAMVPLLTIPISLLGAVAAMQLAGFSLNLLTILAIVLSVGLVVDDAIVIVENVNRLRREGAHRLQAAKQSARQLFAPVVSMTITLAAVYAPIGFMGGLTGLLFREFVFSLAIAVLISGVVALTLSPIMSALVSPRDGQEGSATQRVNHYFNKLQKRYKNGIEWSLTYSRPIAAFTLFATLLMVPLYLFSMKELAPTEDQGSLSVVVTAPPDSTLQYTANGMRETVSTMHDMGSGKYMWQVLFPNAAFSGHNFVDYAQRDFTVMDRYYEAYTRLSGNPYLQVFPVLPSALPTAGQFDVELVVQGDAPVEEMEALAEQIVAEALKQGKFMFVDTDLQIDLLQAELIINRSATTDLGMSFDDVTRQLSTLLSSNYINRFDFDRKAYRVIVQVPEQWRTDLTTLLQIPIQLPDGEYVPLSRVVDIKTHVAPRVLRKFGQRNAFSVYAGVIPGTTKEQGLAIMEDIANATLPKGYSLDYSGESRQIRSEGNSLMSVLGVALIVVFFVLAIQFNSLRDPLVILCGSVPLALAGALTLTFVNFTTVNIYSQIGLITLVGLIAKNAILIIEFANQQQLAGASKLAAIQQAAETRLRPVLMTTGATVLGHFPLVLVTGAGAEARNSIGIVLVGGMLIGTLFTLFVLPALYQLIASEKAPQSIEGP